MQITAFYDPATFTLTYVVWDAESRDAVVIDPVLDFDPIAAQTSTASLEKLGAFLGEHKLTLHYVLETHAHADHLSGSQWLKRRFGAKVAIGEHITEVQAVFKQLFDLPESFRADGRQFDRLLRDDEVVEAGTLRVRVMNTPGHTPACVSYLIGDAVFTGDALFVEDQGTGRTDFPRGSAETLWRSVQRLYALPPATRVFVGHDYQPEGREVRWESTIQRERDLNVHLTAATPQEAYVAFRKGRDKVLTAPRLLFPSVQVNVDAGRLPPAHDNGRRYLVTPLNLFRPTDEDGTPTPQ
jgi:glyoxylase-like metal-dependent hydrolase (beta-lactamase superfamily II)